MTPLLVETATMLRRLRRRRVVLAVAVLVTALLLIPGERSIRHSHESGELSIAFSSELTPIVTWHPPGELHGPPELETPRILEIPASFKAK